MPTGIPKNGINKGWFKKGCNIRKGIRLSKETKQKIKLAHLGKPLSEEHKRKIGESSKGRKHSKETRKKMSLSLIGKLATSSAFKKGHIVTEETKEKIRQKAKRRIGEKNPNWKGGITVINWGIRLSKEYGIWRKKVLIKDNYTCQECKIRGGKLHAHHIKPFSIYVKLRLKISNGQTLCKKCHNSKPKGRKVLLAFKQELKEG